MSNYLSSVLTSTTSKYTTLRRALIPGADESDGDTEDDSHISRVLRAYYTEKQRPFPDWLPPDPRKPMPVQQSALYGSATSQVQGGYGTGGSGRYGGAPQGTSVGVGSARRSGGLSDLWDSPTSTSIAPTGTSSAPTSLRAARNPPAQSGALSAAQTAGRGERYAAGGAASARLTPSGGRPLPSSREGSMQGRFGSGSAEEGRPGWGAAGGGSGVGSTQDRLKARLFGGGGTGGAGGAAGSGSGLARGGASGGVR